MQSSNKYTNSAPSTAIYACIQITTIYKHIPKTKTKGLIMGKKTIQPYLKNHT